MMPPATLAGMWQVRVEPATSSRRVVRKSCLPEVRPPNIVSGLRVGTGAQPLSVDKIFAGINTAVIFEVAGDAGGGQERYVPGRVQLLTHPTCMARRS